MGLQIFTVLPNTCPTGIRVMRRQVVGVAHQAHAMPPSTAASTMFDQPLRFIGCFNATSLFLQDYLRDDYPKVDDAAQAEVQQIVGNEPGLKLDVLLQRL